MQINIELLKKLLALTESDNDSEALIALRRVHELLHEHGQALQNFATERVLYNLDDDNTHLSDPDCLIMKNGDRVELHVRPSAPFKKINLPDEVMNQGEEIARRLRSPLVLAAGTKKAELRIKLEVEGDLTSVLVEPPGYHPIEVWKGPGREAANLASALRQAASHALRK